MTYCREVGIESVKLSNFSGSGTLIFFVIITIFEPHIRGIEILKKEVLLQK